MLARREFCLLPLAALLSAKNRIPVALQLFSVRQQCDKDLPGTLLRVAELGFAGVELAGDYGHQASEWKILLTDRRLICCGAHVAFESLTGARFESTVSFHKALGNSNLVVPGLPAAMTQSEEGWISAAQRLNQIAYSLRPHGIRLGYHNHAVEFKPLNGTRPWDKFVNSLANDVFIELDVGNAGYGGVDPVAIMKQLPDRIRFVHVKDYDPQHPDLPVGAGNVNWREFFAVAHDIPGMEWFIIEHDSDPRANLADISDCLKRFLDKERSA